MTDPLQWYNMDDPYNGSFVWQHSDFRDAPYAHVYKLFEEIVTQEN